MSDSQPRPQQSRRCRAPNTGAAATQTQPTTSTATLTLEPPPAVEAVPADAGRRGGEDRTRSAAEARPDGVDLSGCGDITRHPRPGFAARVNDIAKLGDDDIRASAQVSNRLLEKPMAEMSQGGISQASNVTKSLLSLRKTVEDLDPQKQGNLLSPRKLLGVIPLR